MQEENGLLPNYVSDKLYYTQIYSSVEEISELTELEKGYYTHKLVEGLESKEINDEFAVKCLLKV